MKAIYLSIIFSLIGASCSSNKCKKKSCCPMEGHGRCPICFEEDYLKDINSWKAKKYLTNSNDSVTIVK
jgi:hypothetical protein